MVWRAWRFQVIGERHLKLTSWLFGARLSTEPKRRARNHRVANGLIRAIAKFPFVGTIFVEEIEGSQRHVFRLDPIIRGVDDLDLMGDRPNIQIDIQHSVFVKRAQFDRLD
jgi:hypothetical protein